MNKPVILICIISFLTLGFVNSEYLFLNGNRGNADLIAVGLNYGQIEVTNKFSKNLHGRVVWTLSDGSTYKVPLVVDAYGGTTQIQRYSNEFRVSVSTYTDDSSDGSKRRLWHMLAYIIKGP